MVNPPSLGDESYSQYVEERDGIYNSLKRRAEKLTKFLNSLEGVTCNPSQGNTHKAKFYLILLCPFFLSGAMYAFPQVCLSPKAVEAAKKAGKKPDDFYSIALLDETGVCVVPGSGFGQVDGTFHFRTTFLPSEAQIDSVMEKVAKFHSNFMKRYA
jgi:alanine transaminase